MRRARFIRRWTALAALCTGTSFVLGSACLRDIFASIGATFF
jgi:hypothetical protein